MFNWLKAVANRITGTSTQGISLISNWLAGALWLIETRFLALAQRGYGQNEVVYACLRLLSQSIPEAPLVVYQDSDEERTHIGDREHPLVALIERPNELMTEYEFWEMTTLHMGLVGRATWFKERDRGGRIVALWPLRPDRVGPVYSGSQEEGQRVISGYSYLVPGTSQYISIPRRDIVAFNFPDPAGESGGIVEGLGPLSVLARQVAADNKATDFVGALLANYAAPTVALKIKRSLQLAEATVIKQKFRSEFGGSNQGMVSILDADAEIEQLGFNLQQLEFPDIRRISESRIAAAFGVPAVLVGLSAGLEAATYNNVAGMRRYFAETTLANYWRRYADQYQNDVAVEFGDDLMVEFDTSRVKALAGQREEAIAPVKEAFEKGAVTRNEYRLALGLEPVDGGDVFLVPATMLETMAFVGEPIGKAITVKGLIDYRSNGHGGNGHKGGGLKVVDPRDEAESALLEALATAMSLLSRQVARKISRGEAVSDAELMEAFAGIIEPRLVQVAVDQTMRLGAGVAIGFDTAVINTEAAKWARSYTFELVRRLTETTQEVVRNALAKFTETPGMTIGQLQKLLEPDFGKTRAEMISITEITRAYSQASNIYQAQLEGMGIKMERVWHTVNDEIVRQCPICWPKHMKPEREWKADFPDGPPGHPRCRCSTTLAVIEAGVRIR